MKNRFLTLALIACLIVPCFMFVGCDKDKPTAKPEDKGINVETSTISTLLNATELEDRNWKSLKLNLAAGEYEQITMQKANRISGEGISTSPYVFDREIESLVFSGENKETTKIDGFAFNAGYAVNYVGPNGTHGVDYYEYKMYEVDTLKFENLTFTSNVKIKSLVNELYNVDPTIEIDNLVFENVVFDMANSTDSNGAVHIISQDEGVDNVVFKSCKFINCRPGTTFNGIAIDVRSEDDIDVLVENCHFEDIGYNAIQIAGSGSNLTGDIVIRNNTIKNTGDRAIRFSNIGADAEIVITGNRMTNASDGDGELCKAAVAQGATVNIRDNYWGAKDGLTPVKGMINSQGENILDSKPKAQ